MSGLPVSVIVVSHGRAADLKLCLLGISQLDYPSFEIVLIADKDGIEAASELSFFDKIKAQEFNEQNISQARNQGIALASGDIVAFIDDDAVPEPTWLTHLIAGFSDPDVACAGGFVIGRNGISFQWKARSVDRMGQAADLAVNDRLISVLKPQNGRAIKTEGTNMALRRSVVAQMGGFDPAYRFYLDETDVNMRLALAGRTTAICPLAQVHHGYKASKHRRADRAPKSLFDIAASSAVFMRKYAPKAAHEAVHTQAKDAQRRRLISNMVAGQIEPGQVVTLLAGFDQGWAEGMQRRLTDLLPLPKASDPFLAFQAKFHAEHRVISGMHRKRNALRAAAQASVEDGYRTSLFLFSLGVRRHKVRFRPDGVWEQRGGRLGRSLRSGPRHGSFKTLNRLNFELKRLAPTRGLRLPQED